MKKNAVPVIVIGLLMGLMFVGVASGTNVLFIADTGNDRIKIHNVSDYSLYQEFGSSGLGNDQFDYPVCVRVDSDHIYVLDQGNKDKIKKYHKNNFTFVCESPDALSGTDMCFYSDYIMVPHGYYIKKYLKSDLSYVSTSQSTSYNGANICLENSNTIWHFGSSSKATPFDPLTLTHQSENRGMNDVYHGIGLSRYGTEQVSYIGVRHHTNPIIRHVSGYYYHYGAQGSGNHEYMHPNEILQCGSDRYIVDSGNDRIQKINSGFNYVNQFGSYGTGDMNFDDPKSIAYESFSYNPDPLPDPSCTNCEWNQTSYTTNTPYQFNFTIQNSQPASYTYRFWIYSSEQSALLNSTLITDPITTINITGTINPCWTPQPGLSGQIACYFINGTFKEVLDSNTTDISPVGYNYPITDDLSFNETTYDVTTVNQTFNLTYNISNPQVSCFIHYAFLKTCLNSDGDGSNHFRDITGFNASNTSIEDLFYTTDTEGWYLIGIQTLDNYGNVITYLESDSVYLTSSIKPDYYLHYDKRHYNVNEGVSLEYVTLNYTEAYIQIWWDGRTLYDGTYAQYNDLVASGTVYRVFEKPGRYPTTLFDPNVGGMGEAIDYTYIHEATNGVYIVQDVYHYAYLGSLSTKVDMIISSSTHDDLYAAIYNPSDVMIATIHIEPADYTYGIANVYYQLQPTDQSGTYTIRLRSTPTGANIDSDTCYCRIGEHNVPDIWFVPNEIYQGDMMNLYYYLNVSQGWTLFMMDSLGIEIEPGKTSYAVPTSHTPSHGVFTYQTKPTLAIGNYYGKGYNSTGFTIAADCNVSKGTYDPDAPLLTGVDAFLNVVDVAGFGSTTGKLVIAILIILVTGYMLGKALDAKSQIILISVLIIGFVAIGFIPVWVLVIIALIVGAVITFNLNNG